MCGRVKLPDDLSEIRIDLGIDRDDISEYKPSANAAPTSQIPVVVSRNGKRILTTMRWGLIPWWAHDIKIGASTFNARAEGVETRPAFRDAWQRGRRCLVVAEGFYEWRKTDKQPFAVALGNRGPMTFAGLWDVWRNEQGSALPSFTVITTRANELLRPVHDRMPVLLPPDHWPAWLGEVAATEADLKVMLQPYPSEGMTLWPVDRRVGNVRNDSPDLFSPVPAST